MYMWHVDRHLYGLLRRAGDNQNTTYVYYMNSKSMLRLSINDNN